MNHSSVTAYIIIRPDFDFLNTLFFSYLVKILGNILDLE